MTSTYICKHMFVANKKSSCQRITNVADCEVFAVACFDDYRMRDPRVREPQMPWLVKCLDSLGSSRTTQDTQLSENHKCAGLYDFNGHLIRP